MKTRILLFMHLIALPLLAQDAADYIKDGNKYYKEGKMADAVTAYGKVTTGAHQYVALMNKGNALYRLKKYEEAIKTYQQASSMANKDNTLRSGAFYNTGVVYSNQKKVDESIEAYKSALRLNSNDNFARENLQKALLEKKQQGGGGGGGKDKDQSPSKLNQSQAQNQLDKLEEKEKNTQQRISGNKSEYNSSNEKDW